MSSISLDFLCRERGASTALESLSSSVLGIDCEYYLRRQLQQARTPLLTPWGTCSAYIEALLEHDLQVLESHEITPFFVFPGLSTLSSQKEEDDNRRSARVNALLDLERRKDEETISALLALTTTRELYGGFRALLSRKKVPYLVAPYFAGAQLAYMIDSGDLDAIYTAPDTFLFGASRLITEISFNSPSRVTYCDRTQLLATHLSGLDNDQFLDAYLFAGNDFCPIVPILGHNPPSEYSSYRIRAAADVIRQNGTGWLALNGNPALDKHPKYIGEWLKARVLIKHHPHLNREGNVVLLDEARAPSDSATIFGPRLPREMYFYLSRGELPTELINVLCSGEFFQTRPLGGGDARDYRALLDSLREVYAQTFNLLHGSKLLHNYHEKRNIINTRWYAKLQRDKIDRLETALDDDLRTWQVDASFVNKYSIPGENNIARMLSALNQPEAVHESFQHATKGSLLHQDDLDTMIWYRLLVARGYISGIHQLTAWGVALLRATEPLGRDLSPAMLVAFELLKFHALQMSSNEGKNASPSAANDENSTFLAQIASLLPLEQNDAPWQGPLDRQALAAWEKGRLVREALSNMWDVIRLTILLRGDYQYDRTAAGSQSVNPFSTDHDAGLAVYCKALFNMIGSKSMDVSLASSKLRASFPTATDTSGNLSRALAVWTNLFAAVQHVVRGGLMGSMEAQKFADLNTWLKSSLAHSWPDSAMSL